MLGAMSIVRASGMVARAAAPDVVYFSAFYFYPANPPADRARL
jgi:hypothetical protein